MGGAVGTLGLIAALDRETRILERAWPNVSPWQLRIVRSGPGPTRARLCADSLVAAGVEAIVSFGYAGGLTAGLRPGTALLPQRVISLEGGPIDCDEAMRTRFERRAGEAGVSVESGAIYGAAAPLVSAQAKGALAGSDCIAVDTESHGIAETARQAGLPFLVVRAVVDPLETSLPRAAIAAVDENGALNQWGLVRALLSRPWELPALLELSAQARRADATLARLIGILPVLLEEG